MCSISRDRGMEFGSACFCWLLWIRIFRVPRHCRSRRFVYPTSPRRQKRSVWASENRVADRIRVVRVCDRLPLWNIDLRTVPRVRCVQPFLLDHFACHGSTATTHKLWRRHSDIHVGFAWRSCLRPVLYVYDTHRLQYFNCTGFSLPIHRKRFKGVLLDDWSVWAFRQQHRTYLFLFL